MSDPMIDAILPGIGHNDPPRPIEITRASDLIITANKWVTERKTITDDEQAGKAQDFNTQLIKADKALDTARRAEKLPLEKQLKDIDAKYSPWQAKITVAKGLLSKMRTTFLVAKQAKLDEANRLAKIEAEKLAAAARQAELDAKKAAETQGADAIGAALQAEALAKAAADAAKEAAKPVVARTTGAVTGRQAGLRTTWHARFKPGTTPEESKANMLTAMRVMIKEQEVWNAATEAALRVASREASKDGTPVAGMEFYPEQKAV